LLYCGIVVVDGWAVMFGIARRDSPPRPLLAVPNVTDCVTARPPTADVQVAILLYSGSFAKRLGPFFRLCYVTLCYVQ